MLLSIVSNIYSLNEVLSGIFSESTSLYFYSAVFQGNAALITLAAMYIIYKNQSIDASFDRKADSVIDYLSKSTGMSFNYDNVFDFEAYNEEKFKNVVSFDDNKKTIAKREMGHSVWKNKFKELHSLQNNKNGLWKGARSSIKSILIILLTSILILPFSTSLHKIPLLEPVLFLLFIGYEIYTLVLLYRFIRSNSQPSQNQAIE